MKLPEDIEKEEYLKKKQQMKNEIIEDVKDISNELSGVFNNILNQQKRQKIAQTKAYKLKFPWIWRLSRLFRFILYLFILLIVLNFILLNIWGFITLIKLLFL